MFLRNAWYVAAWDRAVAAGVPLGRVLLNEPEGATRPVA